MPTMVMAVWVGGGDTVTAGLPLIGLEAKKMQLTVLASGDGVVACAGAGGPAGSHRSGAALMRTVDTETEARGNAS